MGFPFLLKQRTKFYVLTILVITALVYQNCGSNLQQDTTLSSEGSGIYPGLPVITSVLDLGVSSAENRQNLEIKGSNFRQGHNVVAIICDGIDPQGLQVDSESNSSIKISFNSQPRQQECYISISNSNIASITVGSNGVSGPVIRSLLDLGVRANEGLNYLQIAGTGFQSTGNAVALLCGGVQPASFSKTSESSTAITVRFATATSDRTCEVTVQAGNLTSSKATIIIRSYNPTVPPVITSVTNLGFNAAENRNYLEVNGTDFLSGGNYVTCVCNGVVPANLQVTTETATKVSFKFAGLSQSSNCKIIISANGVNSNIFWITVPGS